MKRFLILILTLFIFAQASEALAIGLSVQPAKLEIIYTDQTKAQLKIKNISAEPIFSQVSSDDLREFVSIQPDEFTLLPDEIILVDLALDFPNLKSGVKNTNLSIVSRAVNKNSFNAASGIKIPLEVVFSPVNWKFTGVLVFFWTFIILLGFVLLAKLVFGLKKHKKISNIDLNFLFHHKWYLFKKGKWGKLWRKTF
ncbi:hypothetical protein H6761_00450 [Candidatus Nomurabacteria bacterium]|nr:hypothetical protein [Candidatus Nomurabacteria bacterium]